MYVEAPLVVNVRLRKPPIQESGGFTFVTRSPLGLVTVNWMFLRT
jgi:hypothetical protein